MPWFWRGDFIWLLIQEEQCWVHPGHGTVDQLFVFAQLCEVTWEYAFQSICVLWIGRMPMIMCLNICFGSYCRSTGCIGQCFVWSGLCMNAVRVVSAFLVSTWTCLRFHSCLWFVMDRMQLMLERSPVRRYRGNIPVICTDVLLLNVKWLGWNAASPSLSAVVLQWLRHCVTDQMIGGLSLKMSAKNPEPLAPKQSCKKIKHQGSTSIFYSEYLVLCSLAHAKKSKIPSKNK